MHHAAVSGRLVVNEIRRCVANGHSGVIYPSIPMELRDVPHINDSVYDPIWAICQDLAVPICFHAGASEKIQIPAYEGYAPAYWRRRFRRSPGRRVRCRCW